MITKIIGLLVQIAKSEGDWTVQENERENRLESSLAVRGGKGTLFLHSISSNVAQVDLRLTL